MPSAHIEVNEVKLAFPVDLTTMTIYQVADTVNAGFPFISLFTPIKTLVFVFKPVDDFLSKTGDCGFLLKSLTQMIQLPNNDTTLHSQIYSKSD